MSKARLLAELPSEGSAGRSHCAMPATELSLTSTWIDRDEAARLGEIARTSETGSATFEEEHRLTLVLPPFAIESAFVEDRIVVAPLVKLLERQRAFAAFLLRRGGYTVGFFRGESLVDSKTDRRFVKNRHRKGGQSQRRFDRIREKQIHELFGKGCEDASATLTPYEREVEHLFLGGDRQTMIAFRKECNYFDRFGPRLMSRFLPVASDPRRASLDRVPREVWSSDVWIVERS